MTRKHRNLFYILLLCILFLLLLLFWRPYRNRRDQVADDIVRPITGNLKDGGVRPPSVPSTVPPISTYVSIGEAGIEGYDQGTEYCISGRVTSIDDIILPGATVTLYLSGPQPPVYEWPTSIASGRTDSQGRYSIQLSYPVSAAVAVRKEGFATLEDSQKITVPGTIVKNYRMKRAPACIEGIVSDQRGRPLSGASMRTAIDQQSYSGELDLSRLAAFAHSDRNGRYLISNLPEGRVHVSSWALGYGRENSTLVLSADGSCGHMDFRLPTVHVISFFVKDRSGNPIAGAIVKGAADAKRADQNGVVRLDLPLESGPSEWAVSAPGFVPTKITVDPAAPPSVVTLESGELFAGRVLDESGTPVSAARVLVFGSGQASGTPGKGFSLPAIQASEGTFETDAGGRFSLHISNPPVTEIRVAKRGFAEWRSHMNTPVNNIEIRLQSTHAGLFGRVTDEAGTPVHRFTVYLQGETNLNTFTRVFETDDGRFVVSDVPVGAYELIVRGGDSLPIVSVRMGRVEIREGYYFGEIPVRFSKPPQKK